MSLLKKAIDDAQKSIGGLITFEKPLQRAADLVLRCLAGGHKLLVCGNGGSASDATHLATEFLSRFMTERRPYPAISLAANGELITAIGNDYVFEDIFARQVWGLGETGDVLIVITTTGKSRNVLRALEEAKRKGMKSIAFLGRDGGFTKGMTTVEIIVPGQATARIQESQELLFHVMCDMVEQKLPKK
jgi:phosphoheptose isomerase